jgi:hypothetical protein
VVATGRRKMKQAGGIFGTVSTGEACARNDNVGYELAKCLECHDPMNTVRAKDAELAFIVAAEVHQATTTLAAAG